MAAKTFDRASIGAEDEPGRRSLDFGMFTRPNFAGQALRTGTTALAGANIWLVTEVPISPLIVTALSLSAKVVLDHIDAYAEWHR